MGRSVAAASLALVLGACSGGEGASAPTRSDGYTVVASGEVGEFSWSVLRRSTPDDTACWKVETDPELAFGTPFEEWCIQPDPALPREFIQVSPKGLTCFRVDCGTRRNGKGKNA